jgi:hypothetical protein
MKDKETEVPPTPAIQMARFLSVAAVVGHLRGFFFRKVTAGAFGVVILAGTGTEAAVISEQYSVPLGISTLGPDNGQGPAYIIGGVRYRFNWTAAPRAFDFDGNGSTDLTISGNGRSSYTSSMFVTRNGRNQVWSLAGGVGGGDTGSHAIALLGGSTFGPSMHSNVPVIGWHNDDDTGHFSVLMETYESNPASGAFFPSYLFEQKYLGFRFEREGALHYGWMALSGFAFYGEEIYVYSWAYESDSDTALIVGQIPEPTVPALLGFALWIGMRRGRANKSALSRFRGSQLA